MITRVNKKYENNVAVCHVVFMKVTINSFIDAQTKYFIIKFHKFVTFVKNVILFYYFVFY